jgi:hypothetical protein
MFGWQIFINFSFLRNKHGERKREKEREREKGERAETCANILSSLGRCEKWQNL